MVSAPMGTSALTAGLPWPRRPRSDGHRAARALAAADGCPWAHREPRTLTVPATHGTLRDRAAARAFRVRSRRLAPVPSGGGDPMANIKSAIKRIRQNEK